MSEHQDDQSKAKQAIAATTEPLLQQRKVRPNSIYTAELATEICKRIVAGQHVLSFKHDPTMPDPQTFYHWVDIYPDFAAAVAAAREKSADALVDQAMQIADDSSQDTITIQTHSGEYQRVNREWVDRSKVRVGMRQWLAGKFNAKKYGDKTQVEQTITIELGSRLDSALKFRDQDLSMQAIPNTSARTRADQVAIDALIIDVPAAPAHDAQATVSSEPAGKEPR